MNAIKALRQITGIQGEGVGGGGTRTLHIVLERYFI